MTLGTVKWFDAGKGFGFIAPDGGGKDAFVHVSALGEARIDELREGDRVSFELIAGRGGRQQAGKLAKL